MNTDTALVEIGTEELPPTSLTRLAQAFAEQMQNLLSDTRLTFGSVTPLYTPRRMALLIDGIALQQSDHQVSRKGPSLKACYTDTGELSKAALGFLKSVGAQMDDAAVSERDGYLHFDQTLAGRSCADLLPELVVTALGKLPVNRPMRWGCNDIQFVRPVHWVAILLGDQVLSSSPPIMGCNPGGVSYGHRFHAPGPITLTHANHYVEQLRAAYVLVDPQERREKISAQVNALCAETGGHVSLDADLLDEVTNLVEWPCAILGHIEKRFLNIPSEVLVTSMRGDQRYFPVYQQDRSGLLPYFITVSNIDSRNPDTVRKGNERVITPRFEDAEFFWKKDLQSSLHARLDSLKQLVFEKSLGSVYDKVGRIQVIATELASATGDEASLIERAASLCKCDLTTSMVYEFPELQGVMGRYYALHDKEPEAVAWAIEEHYQPAQSGDPIAKSSIGKLIAIADRLDTLVGIFLAGKSPTGDKDPFGIRRATIGIIRISIEGEIEFSLPTLLAATHAVMPATLHNEAVLNQVLEYIIERLRGYFLDAGASADSFEAVRLVTPASLTDFARRIEALSDFRKLPSAVNLCAANKRIRNLLTKTEISSGYTLDTGLFTEAAEQTLHNALLQAEQQAANPMAERAYTTALNILAELQEPIDAFFDQVLVMSEDEQIKNNRLALLKQVYHLFTSIADISALQLAND